VEWICDGSNADDRGDFRPGKKAADELGVRHPLAEAGLTKEEIRRASKEMGLPTWDKPPFACLATRIPYGTEVTLSLLRLIGACEEKLRNEGFSGFRVRYHGNVARVELPAGQWPRLLEPAMRRRVVQAIKKEGFTHVALDLEGYRSGSMNDVLTTEQKARHQ